MKDPARRAAHQEYLAEEEARGLRAARAFPYKLVETTGAKALAIWEAQKAQGDGAAIVLGGDGDISRMQTHLQWMRERGDTPEATLAAADAVRFPNDLFAHRAAQHERAKAIWREEREKGRELWFDPDEGWPPVGPWPEKAYEEPPLCVATQWSFEADIDAPRPATRVPRKRVYIAVLPGADATEAPAHFLWGEWNDVPKTSVLVAALRSWRSRYGAELVGMAKDTWSLRVERRPQTRDEAMALAREMVALCSDLLGEVKTVQGQAALVMENDWWNFWWD